MSDNFGVFPLSDSDRYTNSGVFRSAMLTGIIIQASRSAYPAHWLRLFADDGAGGKRRVSQVDYPWLQAPEFARDRFIIGDPEHCASEIARYRDELGIDLLILRMQYPGQPASQVERSLELTGREVMPRLGQARP